MISSFMMQSFFDLTGPQGSGPSARCSFEKNGGAKDFFQLLGKAQAAQNGLSENRAAASIPSLKGHALMAKLKQSLLSSGLTPDRLTAGSQALASFEKVLVGAGFDQVEVRNLLSEVTANTGAKGVKLSTLFEGISKLKDPSIAPSEPKYLEISALPYLQTLLTGFGLTPEESDSVLNKAKIEGKGIDPARLASALKQFSQSAVTGRQTSQHGISQERTGKMLQRIGLDGANGNSGAPDLNGLIAALEKFSDQKDTARKKGPLAADEALWVAAPASSPISLVDRDDRNSAALQFAAIQGAEDVDASPATNSGNGIALMATQKDLALSAGTSAALQPEMLQGRMEGRVPLDRFAAFLESKTASQSLSGGQPDAAGAWNDFMSQLQPALSEQTSPPAFKTDLRFSETDKAATASVSRPSFTLFENTMGAQASKGAKPDQKAEEKTGQMSAGEADAKKAAVFQQKESPAAGAAANRAEDQGAEDLIRSVKPAAKPDDFSGIIWGDDVARRSELAEATPKALPQSPSAQTLPYYVLDQVSRQILRSRLVNENEIQLQLKPPSLGRLKMNIENTAEGLKVNIIAENSAARDMLLSNSGDLKTALLDQGLRVDHIDVETQAGFDQAMADTRQGSDRSNGRKRVDARHRLESIDDSTAASLSAEQNDNGRLNLVA